MSKFESVEKIMNIKKHFLLNFSSSVIISFILFFLTQSSQVNAHLSEQETTSPFDDVIAYVERDGDIYLHIGKTNQIIQLTFDANKHYYSTPKFSPNGQFLGFLKSDNEKGGTTYDLYIMELETKQAKKLAENVDDWGGFDWAPDNKSIAFGYSIEKACMDYDQTETYGIGEVSIETNQIKEIITPSSPNSPMKKPEYSFDGKFLSFETYPCFSAGFNAGIFDFSSGETSMIGSREIDWSPNQNEIIASNDVMSGEVGDLSLFSANQTTNEIIFESNEFFIADPHWSPKGNLVALRYHTLSGGMYLYSDETTEWEDKLVIMDIINGQIYDICTTEEIWGCRFITWAPKGDQFFFYEEDKGQIDYYLYSLESKQKISFPEISEGGLDWMSYELLPDSVSPTPTSPVEDVFIEPSLEVSTETPQNLKPVETSDNQVLLFLGIGLIGMSFLVAIILFIFKRLK